MLAIVAGPATLAQAATTFGGNPALAPNATGPHGEALDCASGRPSPAGPSLPFVAGTSASSCAWWGIGDSPFKGTGGSGTVTSVTLPAMTDPGPMKVVVFVSRAYYPEHSEPEFQCCEVKELSQVFTPTPNQEFTELLDLPVEGQAEIYKPGQISVKDVVGVSMLSPTQSMPVAAEPGTKYEDFGYLFYPSPLGPAGACTEQCPSDGKAPVTTVEYDMLAQFTLEPASTSTGGGGGGGSTGGGVTIPPTKTGTTITPPLVSPLPAPPSPATGLKLTSGSVSVPTSGKVADLGTASNPPTASTTQTITGVLPVAHSSAVAASKKKAAKKPKAVVLGSGATTVAAGKTAAIAVKLTSAASAALKAGKSLTVTEKITATGTTGLTATTTRTIVLKPTRSKSKKSR
jgi:hypothetical protein